MGVQVWVSWVRILWRVRLSGRFGRVGPGCRLDAPIPVSARSSRLRVARTNLIIDSESTHPVVLGYRVTVRSGSVGPLRFRAGRTGPNRNSAHKYPNMTGKPLYDPEFCVDSEYDPCGLPATTSYEPKRVFRVKPIKSATRADPTEPTRSTKF